MLDYKTAGDRIRQMTDDEELLTGDTGLVKMAETLPEVGF